MKRENPLIGTDFPAAAGQVPIKLEPDAAGRVVPAPQTLDPSLQTIDSSLLSIAGFDPTGGAGVLADVKTFAAHGFHGTACITAMTRQTTLGVTAVEPISAETARKTIDSLIRDLRISALKIGMLGTGEMVQEVCDFLRKNAEKTLKNVGNEEQSELWNAGWVWVVLDPILRSSSGFELLDRAGQERLRGELLGLVDWVTPNTVELGWLLGLKEAERMELGRSRKAVEEAARELQRVAAGGEGRGRLNVVVTGGHLEAGGPDDFLLTVPIEDHPKGEELWLKGEWVGDPADKWHGTGCAFSSALAANLASGLGPVAAVAAAKGYVAGAIRFGRRTEGAGLLEHFWRQGEK